MGLDMYLYKKTYVKNWEHNGPEKQHSFEVKLGGVIRPDIKPERISYITEEVGYWRKFNVLHGWFVENCGRVWIMEGYWYVEPEKMKELLETLQKVQELLNGSELVTKVVSGWDGKDYEVLRYDNVDEVEKIFSPTEGFFFGSNEIDIYFKEEVDRTVVLIEELLGEDKMTLEGSAVTGIYPGDFYYQASC
jgi:hypothetical protein